MKLKMAVVAGTVIVSILVLFTLLPAASYGISGFFSKAFDKSLGPGEQYERNITVRAYYNLTIRFQKEGSSSYLGFNDNGSSIVLLGSNGTVIRNVTGVTNGKHYVLMESNEVRSITNVSAFGISSYSDIIGQSASISYIGSNAYLTITVNYGTASMSGYVVDDLTGGFVDGMEVLAFADSSDPQTAEAVVYSTTVNGRYMLSLDLNSSLALDVYAKDYDVA